MSSLNAEYTIPTTEISSPRQDSSEVDFAHPVAKVDYDAEFLKIVEQLKDVKKLGEDILAARTEISGGPEDPRLHKAGPLKKFLDAIKEII